VGDGHRLGPDELNRCREVIQVDWCMDIVVAAEVRRVDDRQLGRNSTGANTETRAPVPTRSMLAPCYQSQSVAIR